MQDIFAKKGFMYRRREQFGRSLLEVIAVISVFGIIVGGILAVANKVFSGRSNAVVISEIVHIVDGAKTLVSWYPEIDDGSTVILKYLLCQKYMKSSVEITDCSQPKVETSATGILSNGSPITVTSEKSLISDGSSCTAGTAGCHDIITVTVSKLNKSECLALAQTDWGTDFVGMSRGDVLEYLVSSSYTFPLGISDALTFCDTPTDGSYSLTILFF